MTDADWADAGARSVAVYLDGQDDPDVADDGSPLLDDDLLVCTNAWWEPLDVTIPTQDAGTPWTVVVDTAVSPAGGTDHAPDPAQG